MIDLAARTILGNVVAAVVVSFAVCEEVGLVLTGLWLTCLIALSVALVARAEWNRRKDRQTRATHAEMKRRIAEHVAFATAVGVIWSVFILLAAPLLSTWSLIVISLTVLGCVSGSVSAIGACLPVFFGYFLTALPPLVVVNYLHRSSVSDVFAVLVVVYSGAIVANVLSLNRSIVSALRLRTRNEMLAESLAAAEVATAAATRSKWESFAHLSHELRTPMNAVLGFSDMMRRQMFGELSPRYVEYAGNIHSSGSVALGLIDSILEVSRARTGAIALVESVFDPAALVRDVVRDFEADAAAAGISVEAPVDSLGIALHADEARIRQVLNNLLSNALQYTPAGGRVVIDTCHGHNGYCFSISDTGIGIAEDEITLCQEPFVRLGDPLISRANGAGLGLPIARHLLEAHGGTLRLESRLGVGTTVSFVLPGYRCVAMADEGPAGFDPASEPDATPFLRLVGRG